MFFCTLFYQMNKKFHLMKKTPGSISSVLGNSSQNHNLLPTPQAEHDLKISCYGKNHLTKDDWGQGRSF